MITSLSWKNLWRNKTRSRVILGAIALGLFAGTYLSAFMSGWMVGTANDEISTNLSHVQIRDTAFNANNDINAYFLRQDVETKLNDFQRDKANSLSFGWGWRKAFRLNINGMLASANNAVGIRVNGVNVAEEKTVSTIWQTIPDTLGYFLEETEGFGKPVRFNNPIVISQKTAEKLKVKLKSKIVFSFQDANGEMQSMAFRVCGIFKTANTGFDEGNVFVRYDDIFPNTALPEEAVHVAAIMFGDNDGVEMRGHASSLPLEKIDEITPEIKAFFPYLSVEDWKELNPMIALSLGWTDLMVVIILAIFLLALAFGIINTMLMAVLERTRELGMLGAIGMSKRKIFSMLMLETIFLTLAGSVVGIVLATAILIPSIHTGIDLTPLMGDTFEDYGFSSVVYPVLNIKMFTEILVLVILTGVLSAIYPARKALKLKPLEAMRE